MLLCYTCKMRYIGVIFILSILFIISLSNFAYADNKDKSLSLPCLGCHGKSTDQSIPSLFGLEEEYLYSALLAYKLDERDQYLMRIISKAYTDKELKIISKYFALQGVNNE